MAQINLRRHAAGCAPGCADDCVARTIEVNGVDLSMEAFAGASPESRIELLTVPGESGDLEWAQTGLRLTLFVSELTVDGEVQDLTAERFPAAAEAVAALLNEKATD